MKLIKSYIKKMKRINHSPTILWTLTINLAKFITETLSLLSWLRELSKLRLELGTKMSRRTTPGTIQIGRVITRKGQTGGSLLAQTKTKLSNRKGSIRCQSLKKDLTKTTNNSQTWFTFYLIDMSTV